MRKVRFLFFVIIGMMLHFPVQAEVGLPRIINFSRKTTGGGTQNWAIVQAGDQLIYFANNSGMLCFNGIGFKKYPLPNRSILRSVSFDKAMNRLYVGGQDEIGYFGFDERNIPVYTDLTYLLPPSSHGFDDVWSIFQEKEHTYFVCPRSIMDFDGTKIKLLTSPDFIFAKGFKVGAEIYFSTTSNELFLISGGQLKRVEIVGLPPGAEIISLLKLNVKENLLLTRRHGAFRWVGTQLAAWNNFPEEIADGLIYTALRVDNHRIAIGTSLKGLYIVNDSARVILHADVNSGLQNNNILSMLKDASGNLWLGLDNGVDLIRLSSNVNYLVPDGYMKGTGYAMESWGGKLWFGTNNGLFYKDKNSEETYTLLPGTEGQVWNLQVISGILYIDHHEGLFSFDGTTLGKVSGRIGSWDVIELKKHPGFYLQGCYSGLSLLQLKNGRLAYVSDIEGFSESCRFMAEDKDGSIWVSQPYKGLFRLSLSDDLKGLNSVTKMGEKNNLSQQMGNYVFDLGNEVVFTCNSSVYRYNPGKAMFEHYRQFEQLLGRNTTIYRLYSSSRERIWFIGNGKVGFISVLDEGLQRQLSIHLLPAFDLELTSVFERVKELDGKIYFTLETGFLSLPLNNIALQANIIPEVIISNVSITDTASRQVLINYNSASKAADLTFAERNFEISFGSTNAFFVDSIEYSTWLVGFEEGWQPWSLSKFRGFSQLPYGSYLLKVKSRYLGKEGKELVLPIRILTPWYWSFWAKLVYLTILLSLLLAGIVYPQRRVWRKSQRIIEEKNKRMKHQEELFKEETQRNEETIMRLKNETLQAKIDFQNQNLASATMHILQKNNILFAIKEKLNKATKGGTADPALIVERFKEINRLIEQDSRTEKGWDDFEMYFDQVYSKFIQTVRQTYPQLSQNDIRICAYLRMNLSTKEIATLMNISVRGVEITRYRLRKKLDLDNEVNLSEFVQRI